MPQKLKNKAHTEKLGKVGILGIMLHIQGHRHLLLIKRPMASGMKCSCKNKRQAIREKHNPLLTKEIRYANKNLKIPS